MLWYEILLMVLGAASAVIWVGWAVAALRGWLADHAEQHARMDRDHDKLRELDAHSDVLFDAALTNFWDTEIMRHNQRLSELEQRQTEILHRLDGVDKPTTGERAP